jgi:16S rRNA processing protein RimM
MDATSDNWVSVGHISGVYGVRGWVKVHSYTEPRDNIVRFTEWRLAQPGSSWSVALEDGRSHGKSVLAKLDGIDDRDRAAELIGAQISVERAALPPCEPGEYYWADLEGLAVRSEAGEWLGTVDHLLATGAHDVLVMREDARRMIPFVMDKVVRDVDLERGVIVVSWDASFWED